MNPRRLRPAGMKKQRNFGCERSLSMPEKKTVLITGGNAGIGLAAATAIALSGAQVILACRNQAKAAQARQNILAVKPDADVQIRQLDLSSLAGIRKFSSQFMADHSSLDVLINNAGIMPTTQQFTEDGFEMQFGVNYLGHFLLTHLLTPVMKNVSDARIIHLSSIMHNLSGLNFDSFRGRKRYFVITACAQSKLANLLFSYELARRLPPSITSNALHPGGVDSEIYRDLPKPVYWTMKPFLITADRAAKLIKKMAFSDEWKGVTGQFKAAHGPLPVSRAAKNVELRRRLYEESCKMTGVEPL
jgi:NAD(P)-dependent dehydrogenase (short-subunit alcohol dehydrogenase family)